MVILFYKVPQQREILLGYAFGGQNAAVLVELGLKFPVSHHAAALTVQGDGPLDISLNEIGVTGVQAVIGGWLAFEQFVIILYGFVDPATE